MEILIKLDKRLYEYVKHHTLTFGEIDEICDAITNGVQLPKGHGRLIDISKIDEDRVESDNPIIYLTMNGDYIEVISLDYLNNLPTIIEADKEE